MYRLDSFDSRQGLLEGCFKHGYVTGFIKSILLISQAGLCDVELVIFSPFFICTALLCHLPICRSAIPTKDSMFWNVGLQTDSSDIPIWNKYVNSNRIPVSGGVISWYSRHPQICHLLTI
jgi:hypothetical protein